MKVTKEYMDQFLQIVNAEANSTVRSKPNRGTFSISETTTDDNQIIFDFVYTQNDIVYPSIRKKYDLNIITLEDAQSSCYQEFIKYCILGNTVKTEFINVTSVKDLINLGYTD